MTDADETIQPTLHPDELKPLGSTPFATPQRLRPVREFIRLLAVSDNNISLYPPTHPAVKQSLEDFLTAMRNVAMLSFNTLTISVHKRTLFIENQVFVEESTTFAKLIDKLLSKGITSVTFSTEMVFNDVLTFVQLLNDGNVYSLSTARDFLAQHEVESIEVDQINVLDDEEDEQRHENFRTEARRSYDIGVSVMRDIESRVKYNQPLEVGPLQEVADSLLQVMLQDPAAVLGLTAIKSYEDYSLNHALNVSILSMSLGNVLGLDRATLKSLALAGLLYDIGKFQISDALLAKSGPLTDEEWRLIKAHSKNGANLLKSLPLDDMMPMIVAYEHHLRYDMSGYPEGDDATQQHLFSSIVALCDAYDAMTTMLPFRREMQPELVLATLLEDEGKAFNATVTKFLIMMLGVYPVGSVVMLDDGSTGVVYRINADTPLKPKVKKIIDPTGCWLEEPELLDLRIVNQETGKQPTIVKCFSAIEAGVDDVWEYL